LIWVAVFSQAYQRLTTSINSPDGFFDYQLNFFWAVGMELFATFDFEQTAKEFAAFPAFKMSVLEFDLMNINPQAFLKELSEACGCVIPDMEFPTLT
jgi:hypothetical protein